LYQGFGQPAIAVDTHVHRISNRLGLVRTKKPEETEEQLRKLIPKHLWGPMNGSMVEFGRKICLPVRPRCENCPLNGECKYFLQKGR
ncbi:MAG: endonuclease, partial [Pseudothermotoga sp.]|nr:endonuclease [Pseudothermotoga sp.]